MQARRALIGDILAGLALIAVALYVIIAAEALRGEGWLVPTVLAWLVGGGSVLLIVKAILAWLLVAGERSEATGVADAVVAPLAALVMPLALLLVSIVYAWLIPRLGFYIASALFLPVVLAMLGMRRWWVHLSVVVGFVAFTYFVFARTFNIPMPRAAWLAGLW